MFRLCVVLFVWCPLPCESVKGVPRHFVRDVSGLGTGLADVVFASCRCDKFAPCWREPVGLPLLPLGVLPVLRDRRRLTELSRRAESISIIGLLHQRLEARMVVYGGEIGIVRHPLALSPAVGG